MGQQTSNPQLTSASLHAFNNEVSKNQPQLQPNQKPKLNEKSSSSYNHEGILRVQKTPFENCQKIQFGDQIYFMEQTKISLRDLTKQKKKIKKYFSQEQIIRMIQSVTYTLAYLQNINYPYPMLTIDSIYQSNSTYKLLPPQSASKTIYSTLYSEFKNKQKPYMFLPASPQLIIALRCHQPQIRQPQILFKSNVFALGMIMLQISTLKNSADCYDLQTYDIIDQIVTQRIEEIQGRYGYKIAGMVANMLDYDFDERMLPKDLAVWVNRQVNDIQDEIKNTPSFPKDQTSQEPQKKQQQMIKSRLIVQTQVPDFQIPKYKNKNGRTSQQRINEIRNKIVKQKLKLQKQMIESKEIQKSRKKLRSPLLKQNNQYSKSKSKNLPNPYLNPHILTNAKSTQKISRSPHQIKPLDLGIHDISKLRHQPSRFLYTNACQQDLTSDRDRSINLKYKYNINGVSRYEQQSVQLSSNRKRDGQRYVRVEKYIASYQRSGSNKKYDYGDVLGEEYQRSERGDTGRQSERKYSRSPSYRNYQMQSNYNHISDFTFQPPKGNSIIVQKTLRSQLSTSNLSKKPSALNLNSNINPSGVLQSYQQQIQLSKQPKDFVYQNDNTNQYTQHLYEKHQDLFNNYNQNNQKVRKNNGKQNQDVLLIKKQIERSRKLIQEVRKSQQNNIKGGLQRDRQRFVENKQNC